MTSAQRSDEIEELPSEAGPDAPLPPFALKQQVAERLAAHRARRVPLEHAADRGDEPQAVRATGAPRRARSAQIAAAVAERYAQTPSYRAFLAAEAERSVQQAQAAAEVATINAHAIAMAQQQLLADLEHWNWTAETARATSVAAGAAEATASVVRSMVEGSAARVATAAHAAATTPVQQVAGARFTVKLYEDVGRATPAGTQRAIGGAPAEAVENEAERDALDDEIAFRKDPYFDDLTAPEPIPANLIEFPRQLVAPRRARPRHAEGPLRDEDPGAETAAQLRIFEVRADQISTAPASEAAAPEWASIMLGALPSTHPEPLLWGDLSPTLVPQAAPLSLRIMSGFVDGAIVAAGTAAFAATAVETHTLLTHGAAMHLTLPFAAAALGGAFLVLTVVYLLLSFSVAESTVGMRYARIGLCTFADENPTRRAMRRRVLAMFLSAAPVALGFAWACLDEDRLSWHDRMSRMYQRAY